MVVVEYTSAYWRTHGLLGIKPIVINYVMYAQSEISRGAPAPSAPLVPTPLKPIILDCMSLKYFDKVTQLISKFLVAPASL